MAQCAAIENGYSTRLEDRAGSLTEVAENGLSDDVGLLVNSSRGIIYASQGKDYAAAAASAAHDLQSRMQTILEDKGFITC